MKIEGDWNKGSILIADFHSSRMAMRWQVAPKRRFDPYRWAEDAIAAEVGQLMLAKSDEYVPKYNPGRGAKDKTASSLIPPSPAFSSGRLFVEPDPPGRDVWVGVSRVSNRLLEVVYQTKTRTNVLRDEILPRISDTSPQDAQHWSIFDLSCSVPTGWRLTSQRLNAGDLSLSFGLKNDVLIVRQLAPATLALSRQPLGRWLDAQQQIWKKTYRVKGPIEPLDDDDNCLMRKIPRRRRFFLAKWIMPQRVTLAAHDQSRDRIAMIDASTLELAQETLETVGKEPG